MFQGWAEPLHFLPTSFNTFIPLFFRVSCLYPLSITTSLYSIIGSGVKTKGSGGSMNWGPELLKAPSGAIYKNKARK